MKTLSPSFYSGKNTVNIAQSLLGKVLVTRFQKKITSGIIVETEAYCGAEDRACHAFGYRKTPRNEIMFAEGGVAYVYLCYGIHHLFNVVTHHEGEPHAVLIRAVEPLEGIETMLKRRRVEKLKYTLTSGPGSAAEALGIKTLHTGFDLMDSEITIEDRGIKIPLTKIIASPRVGISFAGDDALLPYRFRIKENPWTSRAK